MTTSREFSVADVFAVGEPTQPFVVSDVAPRGGPSVRSLRVGGAWRAQAVGRSLLTFGVAGVAESVPMLVSYPATEDGDDTPVASPGLRRPLVLFAHGFLPELPTIPDTLCTSAPADREEPANWFKGFGYALDELARAGIVAVSVDMRPAPYLAEFELLRQAHAFLVDDSDLRSSIDGTNVGLVGHSHNGPAAVFAAFGDDDLAHAVSAVALLGPVGHERGLVQPVFYLHGAVDAITSDEDTKAAFCFRRAAGLTTYLLTGVSQTDGLNHFSFFEHVCRDFTDAHPRVLTHGGEDTQSEAQRTVTAYMLQSFFARYLLGRPTPTDLGFGALPDNLLSFSFVVDGESSVAEVVDNEKFGCE